MKYLLTQLLLNVINLSIKMDMGWRILASIERLALGCLMTMPVRRQKDDFAPLPLGESSLAAEQAAAFDEDYRRRSLRKREWRWFLMPLLRN